MQAVATPSARLQLYEYTSPLLSYSASVFSTWWAHLLFRNRSDPEYRAIMELSVVVPRDDRQPQDMTHTTSSSSGSSTSGLATADASDDADTDDDDMPEPEVIAIVLQQLTGSEQWQRIRKTRAAQQWANELCIPYMGHTSWSHLETAHAVREVLYCDVKWRYYRLAYLATRHDKQFHLFVRLHHSVLSRIIDVAAFDAYVTTLCETFGVNEAFLSLNALNVARDLDVTRTTALAFWRVVYTTYRDAVDEGRPVDTDTVRHYENAARWLWSYYQDLIDEFELYTESPTVHGLPLASTLYTATTTTATPTTAAVADWGSRPRARPSPTPPEGASADARESAVLRTWHLLTFSTDMHLLPENGMLNIILSHNRRPGRVGMAASTGTHTTTTTNMPPVPYAVQKSLGWRQMADSSITKASDLFNGSGPSSKSDIDSSHSRSSSASSGSPTTTTTSPTTSAPSSGAYQNRPVRRCWDVQEFAVWCTVHAGHPSSATDYKTCSHADAGAVPTRAYENELYAILATLPQNVRPTMRLRFLLMLDTVRERHAALEGTVAGIQSRAARRGDTSQPRRVLRRAALLRLIDAELVRRVLDATQRRDAAYSDQEHEEEQKRITDMNALRAALPEPPNAIVQVIDSDSHARRHRGISANVPQLARRHRPRATSVTAGSHAPKSHTSTKGEHTSGSGGHDADDDDDVDDDSSGGMHTQGPSEEEEEEEEDERVTAMTLLAEAEAERAKQIIRSGGGGGSSSIKKEKRKMKKEMKKKRKKTQESLPCVSPRSRGSSRPFAGIFKKKSGSTRKNTTGEPIPGRMTSHTYATADDEDANDVYFSVSHGSMATTSVPQHPPLHPLASTVSDYRETGTSAGGGGGGGGGGSSSMISVRSAPELPTLPFLPTANPTSSPPPPPPTTATEDASNRRSISSPIRDLPFSRHADLYITAHNNGDSDAQ